MEELVTPGVRVVARKYCIYFPHSERKSGGARLRIVKGDPPNTGEDWARLIKVDARSSLGGPWELLRCCLEFEHSSPFLPETSSKWERWMKLAQVLEAPYFLVNDGHGHPLVLFRGVDEVWYGFLLDFGLVAGQWSWLVPGDTVIGSHEYRPVPVIVKEILASLPSGLFEVNPHETLTLKEVLEEVLGRYSPEEQARCWIRVYRLAGEHSGEEESSFPLSRLEAERKALADTAWTLLSPDIRMWDELLRAALRFEMGHPTGGKGVDEKLALMKPAQRLAFLKALGYRITPPYTRQMERVMDIEPGRRRAGEELVDEASRRLLPSQLEYAKKTILEEKLKARKTLAQSAIPAEVYFTTNIFAAAWQQLLLAVDSQWVLRACEECGLAFLSRTYHRKLCENCSTRAAVSKRYRDRMKAYRESQKRL